MSQHCYTELCETHSVVSLSHTYLLLFFCGHSMVTNEEVFPNKLMDTPFTRWEDKAASNGWDDKVLSAALFGWAARFRASSAQAAEVVSISSYGEVWELQAESRTWHPNDPPWLLVVTWWPCSALFLSEIGPGRKHVGQRNTSKEELEEQRYSGGYKSIYTLWTCAHGCVL